MNKKLRRSLISVEESPQIEQQTLHEQWKKQNVVVWGKKKGDHATLYCSRVIWGTPNNADPLMEAEPIPFPYL